MDKLLNNAEFAEIIDIETDRVERESEFKKQYHRGLKVVISKGNIFYEVEGVEKLRQKYNKLVDILNERNNNE